MHSFEKFLIVQAYKCKMNIYRAEQGQRPAGVENAALVTDLKRKDEILWFQTQGAWLKWTNRERTIWQEKQEDT